ncbi:hypothetical protein DPMN_105585 [Dreissena polymorpha]|uniref:Tesmin/TSO1-like CXC domain-containing protein n=1 Tax=Dreissena polymorpha TaxID=45954 RepID=A0A9D4QHM1_DREPO|nr:hypothetical protein DPMN_105585 [Dreissena polymorpha]
MNFGQTLSDTPEDVLLKAEEYLVQVIKPNSQCTTMDSLRYDLHHTGKAADIQSLPPTSHSIKDQILKCLYTTFLQVHCMDETQTSNIDPQMYGYTTDEHGHSVPTRAYKSVPDKIAVTCACKECSTKRCLCRKAGVSCCKYCKCRSNCQGTVCKNPNNLLSVPVQIDK